MCNFDVFDKICLVGFIPEVNVRHIKQQQGHKTS